MKHRKLTVLVFAGLFGIAGCGSDPAAPPGNGGNGGGGGGGPIDVFDIFLRPYVIERGSSLADGLPSPQQAQYALTAFYNGGEVGATFSWGLDPRLGVILPKTIELATNSVTISLLNPGDTPIGFYDISVDASSGGLQSSMTKRFAVVELNWMKHERATITNPAEPPVDLELDPVFVPRPTGEMIYFSGAPSRNSVSLWAIVPDRSFASPPEPAETALFRIPFCDLEPCAIGQVNSEQARTADEREPDPSPATLGRDELLFASQMDPQYYDRLTTQVDDVFPFNLWVVKQQTGVPAVAKALTFDVKSTGAVERYAVHQHRQPRWDPSSVAGPGQAARIAFISNRGPDPMVSYPARLWLADLLDSNSDGVSDTLVNMNAITEEAVSSFDWTPDGQFIYFLRGGSTVYRLNVANPTQVEEIDVGVYDPELGNLGFISVFRGDANLLAFQGTSENRVYLYVLDRSANSLVRITPYEFATGRNLFPRWHPTRREVVFVCDYTVARWLNGGDVYPLGNPGFAGQIRTLYPSVWTVRLQER
ncbi:MAG TPA: hypothetical protein VFD07_05695 [Candidatus Krumholzibacteria bacterium]|nr:hypothetical protein [Candidatus Krumholzibacteria bacterium]